MARPKKYNGETEVVSFRVPKTMTAKVRKVVEDILNPKVPPPPLGYGHPIADKVEMESWKEEAKVEIKRLQHELENPPKHMSISMKLYCKVREDRIKELNNLF
jgi:hypothetical protein